MATVGLTLDTEHPPRRRSRVRRIVVRVLGTAILVPALVALAVLLGAQPVPTRHAAAGVGSGVTIAIVDNGFHTDIALQADGRTLAALGLQGEAFPVPRDLVRWWGIGWGSRTAYTSLRAISDLSPAIVARSVAFDRTVMHVAPWGKLVAGPRVRFVEVDPDRYDALLTAIAADFRSTDAIAGLTQGFGDRYYEGQGRFTAWYGCNAWVGAKLRHAGIPVGLWTPTAQSISYGLDRISGGTHR